MVTVHIAPGFTNSGPILNRSHILLPLKWPMTSDDIRKKVVGVWGLNFNLSTDLSNARFATVESRSDTKSKTSSLLSFKEA